MVETLILELANISNGPEGAHTSNGPGGAHISNGPGGAHRRSIDWSIKPATGASNLSLDLSIDCSIKSTTGAPNLSLDPSIDWSIKPTTGASNLSMEPFINWSMKVHSFQIALVSSCKLNTTNMKSIWNLKNSTSSVMAYLSPPGV
jgi:hypothetical protein